MRRTAILCAALAVLAACDRPATLPDGSVDRSRDTGFDAKDLSELKAGIWIDPTGCDHWIIDDGFEGYLSQRLDRYGKPVCSGIAEPNTAVRDFKRGSAVPDVF